MRTTLRRFAVSLALAIAVASAARGQDAFYAIQPCRVFDTRVDTFGANGLINKNASNPVAAYPIIADTSLTPPNLGTNKVEVDVASQCGLSGAGWIAKSIAYNLTVTEPSGGQGSPFANNGLVMLYPWPVIPGPPTISLLNFRAGTKVAGNGGIVGLDSSGHMGVTVVSSGGSNAHVILDVTGYFR